MCYIHVSRNMFNSEFILFFFRMWRERIKISQIFALDINKIQCKYYQNSR